MKFLLHNNSISINVAGLAVVLGIFLNHFIRYFSRAPNTIPDRPKVTPTISFGKLWIFFLKPARGSTLQPLNNITYVQRSHTWSLLTTPLSIFISFKSQICLKRSRNLFWISPSKTLYLYFLTQTMWAVSRDTLWLPISCSLLKR
jgi:hypothetical protein